MRARGLVVWGLGFQHLGVYGFFRNFWGFRKEAWEGSQVRISASGLQVRGQGFEVWGFEPSQGAILLFGLNCREVRKCSRFLCMRT